MGVKSCFALNSKSLMNLAFMVLVEGFRRFEGINSRNQSVMNFVSSRPTNKPTDLSAMLAHGGALDWLANL
jgi:hypothetical protein